MTPWTPSDQYHTLPWEPNPFIPPFFQDGGECGPWRSQDAERTQRRRAKPRLDMSGKVFWVSDVYNETWSTGRNQQGDPWGLKRHSWRLEPRAQVGIRLKRKSRARSWRMLYTILRSCALSEAVGNHWRALSKGLSAWQLRTITLDTARMRVEKSGQALSFHAGLIFLIF